MQERKNKIHTSTLVIFWLILAFFILMVFSMYAMPVFASINQYIFIPSMAIISSLGIALIILAVKSKFIKLAKAFFILTGSSAAGITVFGVLHNLLFALLIKLFGEGIWGSSGDEPVFFILATIVCPLALLVGIIGCIVLIARKKIKV